MENNSKPVLKNRPLSPHIQIYKIFSTDMTSGLSILHRLSEVIFALIFFLVVLSIVFFSIDLSYHYWLMRFSQSVLGKLFISMLWLGLYFYLFQLIRYLIFTTGFAIELKYIKLIGWLSILFTVLCFMPTMLWLWVL